MENKSKLKEISKNKRIARTVSFPNKSTSKQENSNVNFPTTHTKKGFGKSKTQEIQYPEQSFQESTHQVSSVPQIPLAEGYKLYLHPLSFACSYTFPVSKFKHQIINTISVSLGDFRSFVHESHKTINPQKTPLSKSDNQIGLTLFEEEQRSLLSSKKYSKNVDHKSEKPIFSKKRDEFLNAVDCVRKAAENRLNREAQERIADYHGEKKDSDDCKSSIHYPIIIQWPPPRKINRSLTNYDKERKREKYKDGRGCKDNLSEPSSDSSRPFILQKPPRKIRKPPSIADIVWHKCKSLEDIITGEEETSGQCKELSKITKETLNCKGTEKDKDSDSFEMEGEGEINKSYNFESSSQLEEESASEAQDTYTDGTQSIIKILKEDALSGFNLKNNELSESSSQESVGQFSKKGKLPSKPQIESPSYSGDKEPQEISKKRDYVSNLCASPEEYEFNNSENEERQDDNINKWFGETLEYTGNMDTSHVDGYNSEGEPRSFVNVLERPLAPSSFARFPLCREENSDETNWNYERSPPPNLKRFKEKRVPSGYAQILSQASTDSEGRDDIECDLSDPLNKRIQRHMTILSSKSAGRESEHSQDSTMAGEFFHSGFTLSRNASPGPYNIDSDSGDRSAPRSPYIPRRYSKRPLRGPYGEMLEAEMSKSKPNSQYLCEEIYLHPHEDKNVVGRPSSPQSPTLMVPKGTTFQGESPAILISEDMMPLQKDARDIKGSRSFDESAIRLLRSNAADEIPHDPFSPENAKDSLVLSTIPNHQRTASSPSKLFYEPDPSDSDKEVLKYFSNRRSSNGESEIESKELRKCRNAEEYDQGNEREPKRHPSSVGLPAKKGQQDADHTRSLSEHRHAHRRHRDTRPHVVGELRDTESNYVRNLGFLLNKYNFPLRSPEYSSIVDPTVLDAIFYQVPEIHSHHAKMLDELKKRLESQDESICVGDILLKMLKDPHVLECYSSFINNWKTAQEAAKAAAEAKPAFRHFLMAMSREHPGKRELKSLLIAPVQRFPRYELILKRLLEHTSKDHPDFTPLKEAISEVQKIATVLNEIEQETLKQEQKQFILKEIETCIEGIVGLQQPDRTFLQVDQVSQHSNLGMRKERCLFLFSDLLVITSVKRRSATVRKITSLQPVLLNFLESCKLKLFKFIPLDDIEIGRSREDSIKRKFLREIEALEQDLQTLQQVSRLVKTLHFPKGGLEEALSELDSSLNKQHSERQRADSHLSELELNITTAEGVEVMGFIFHKPEAKDQWEEAFNSAKHKQAQSADRRPPPEFVGALPIRKTRAGLQFTCAAPILSHNAHNLKDVWVCNSDGYVGQVCVMSLQPEPTLASCIGVCNAKILSIASVPSAPHQSSVSIQRFSYRDSSDEDEDEEIALSGDLRKRRSESLPPEISLEQSESQQPTMWLGTEDGSIIVYNCSDTIRTKRNKFKFQPGSPVHCIIHVENRVFASLANGDIIVYDRDCLGCWNGGDKQVITLSTPASPVSRMVVAAGQLWCSVANGIRVVNVNTLHIEHTFSMNGEDDKTIACMVSAGHGVWIAVNGSAVVKLFHATTYELVYEVGITSAVTKMLAGCDDIIRQHKAACLRVTSLLACKDLLWIGTSAGVIITIPLPHLSHNTRRIQNPLNMVGISHGHTGHVRFLTCVELTPDTHPLRLKGRFSFKGKEHAHHQPETVAPTKFLVIAGGDGYEDFRNSSASESAGKDDSTNHLLLWHV